AHRRRACIRVGERRLQAVHHRQQGLGEALQRIFLGVCGLGLEALASVLRIGERAQHGFAVTLGLGVGLGELLLDGLLGFLWLNGFLLHLVEVGIAGRYFKRSASLTTY